MARRFIILAVLPFASPTQDRKSALPACALADAMNVGLKTLQGPHHDAPASRMTSLSVEASAASKSSSLVTWGGA